MTSEVAVSSEKTFYALADDLTCFFETLSMLNAQIAAGLPDEERSEIEQQRGEVLAHIEQLNADLARKTDGVAIVLRRMDVEADYIREERRRLKAKEEAVEHARETLRNYIVKTMQMNGIKTLKTATNTLCIGSTTAVEITDPTLIPAEFLNAEVKMPYSLWLDIKAAVGAYYTERSGIDALRVKTEPSASIIKRALKSGDDVPGADLALKNHLICR